MKKITLVGGGLAGSLMAVYLAKRGYQVDVYERRPDMRNVEIPAGKSINLALSTRGINALSRVGLSEAILKKAIPMKGRMMHSTEGELSYQPYGKDGQHINSVSRAHLNVQLLELADENPNVHLHFNMKCTKVDLENAKCWFKDKEGNSVETTADAIIGADGAFSAVRNRMMRNAQFNYSQEYLPVGYKELCINPINGEFALDPNCLHIWPRGKFMMIALPNPDKSFTCTLFQEYEGPSSIDSLETDQQILDFFKLHFPDAVPLMPDLVQDFKENPTGSLVTVRCYPWNKGKATLMGDACHAVVPFYGQGMNCAFEDCVVMAECLDEFENWDEAMQEYQERRKTNADAIADLAIQNFTEMSDLVADDEFLEYKRVEHELSELYPDFFKSQYEMVTFTNIPYRDALNIGARNTVKVKQLINENHLDKLENRDFIEKWFAV